MNPTTALYAAILFVLLTPGVILRIPSKGSLLTASIVHAIVFGILLYFISKIVHQYKYGRESFKGFKEKPTNVVSVNNIRCNVDNCNKAIRDNIENKKPIPSIWWSMDEDKAGGGCTGCTIPSDIKIVPDPKNGVGINVDDQGCKNSAKEPSNLIPEEVKQLEKNNCNPEECNDLISKSLEKNNAIYLENWNNINTSCYGCTLPLNAKIIPEDKDTYILNATTSWGCPVRNL